MEKKEWKVGRFIVPEKCFVFGDRVVLSVVVVCGVSGL